MSSTFPPHGVTARGEPAGAPTHVWENHVLFVDVDGTLIKSDVLWECALVALKQQPSLAIKAPFWLLRGRAHFKRSIAAAATLDVRKLPFRETVLEFIKERAAQRQHIVLATAADASHANEIAEQLGIFDAVLASDGRHNLKGRAKLAAIEEYCANNGFSKFEYLADDKADLPIWRCAAFAYVVEPAAGVTAAIIAAGTPTEVLEYRTSRVRASITALRPQQWIKNAAAFRSAHFGSSIYRD